MRRRWIPTAAFVTNFLQLFRSTPRPRNPSPFSAESPDSSNCTFLAETARACDVWRPFLTKETLETAKSWVGTISPEGVTTYGEEEGRNIWQADNAAFMI